ncbi:hypothetical protein VNO80_24737 [Phaseolus coccineus]|uniref:Uncharacterized protein n=1 Tax=Phaseolus coccineus TaxID=3886 RepID=A0AAN9LY52_PHACN
MDSLLTPLSGKGNDSKPNIKQKTNQVNKRGKGEAQRQNRVRTTNILQAKPAWDKSSITKTKITVQKKQHKSISTAQLPITSTDKKSTENVNHGVNKKSDTFPQLVAGKTSKNKSQMKSCASEPKTPAASLSPVRTKSSTPFYTALHCSECRFDKLETSSYRVGHIKMAESVDKHFVASDESQAEPIRNLRMEHKRYLLRHEYLWEQKEWREVGARYGMDSATLETKNGSDAN